MSVRLCPPLARLLLAGSLAFALPGLPRAQEAVPPTVPGALADPGFATLAWQIQNDPDGALDRIAALVEAMDNGRGADPRIVFDLYALAADLMIEGGQVDQAAQVKAQLAGFAVQFRDGVDIDPLPLFAEAAALLEDTGQFGRARDALLAMIAEQRAGAQPEAEIAASVEALRRVAAEMGAPPPELSTPERVPGAGGFRRVGVYYATDRARSGSPRAAEYYSGGRGELELGRAEVAVPDRPLPGVMPPPMVWPLEFGAAPVRHAALLQVAPLAAPDFRARLSGELAQRPAPEVLVYIHGYGMGFEQAARRAAQLAYDLAYDGVPLLYSWPSRGSSVGYISDTAAVRPSARRLAMFLADLAAQPGAPTVHLVAEGMGNRALADALELLAARRGPGTGRGQDAAPAFGQVIFAAPDLDAGLLRAMLPQIRPLAQRLTLYATDRDRGLGVADMLYGDALRAGLGGDLTLTDPALDSVDLSDPLAEVQGQGMFAGPGAALADLATLLWRDTAPARRCGLTATPAGEGDQPVWIYDGTTCPEAALAAVLAHLRQAGAQTPEAARAVLRRVVPDPGLAQRLEPVLAKSLEE
ncbi:MAG: alpha/beta hydrolase [Pseudodonghicola sp.]